jgi:hypothetical protein
MPYNVQFPDFQSGEERQKNTLQAMQGAAQVGLQVRQAQEARRQNDWERDLGIIKTNMEYANTKGVTDDSAKKLVDQANTLMGKWYGKDFQIPEIRKDNISDYRKNVLSKGVSLLSEFQKDPKKGDFLLGEWRKLNAEYGAQGAQMQGDDKFHAENIASTLSGEKAGRVEVMEAKLANTKESQFKNRINNQKARMINDPRIKPLYSQGIGLGQIKEIANIAKDGNTVAAAALGVKMARGMGEVGVLTESDVTRYITSGRLDRKAADTLSRWMVGKPTDATMEEINQISSVLSDAFSGKIQPVYNEYIESLAELENETPDEISKKMAIPYRPIGQDAKEEKSSGPSVETKTGKKVTVSGFTVTQ